MALPVHAVDGLLKWRLGTRDAYFLGSSIIVDLVFTKQIRLLRCSERRCACARRYCPYPRSSFVALVIPTGEAATPMCTGEAAVANCVGEAASGAVYGA